jgi:hypothetical protein
MKLSNQLYAFFLDVYILHAVKLVYNLNKPLSECVLRVP